MTPLRKRMTNDMGVRGLTENTMRLYCHTVSGLTRYFKRSPERVSAQVQNYLLHLHEERGPTWQSCNCARQGIRFLYRVMLDRPDPHFYAGRQDAFEAARDPQPRRVGQAIRVLSGVNLPVRISACESSSRLANQPSSSTDLSAPRSRRGSRSLSVPAGCVRNRPLLSNCNEQDGPGPDSGNIRSCPGGDAETQPQSH